ncbi:MAG: metallophosphoesterase family protein [Thermodesulfobacteriota bacterium]
MIIGVISDTHLRMVTSGLRRIMDEYFRDAEIVLHAGDMVTGEVWTYLRSRRVVAVHGNMDHREVTSVLPPKRTVQAGPFTIGLVHGFGAPRGLAETLRREFDRLDCLVFGHSHQPLNRKVGRELWFNPGAAGDATGTIGLLHAGESIEGEIIHLK